MKPVVKILILVLALVMVGAICVGCYDTQADRVRQNLATQSDAFNVVRRVTVVNCITNEILLQCEGKISITADTVDDQLEILIEADDGTYQKNIIGLSDNVTYLVEDINTSCVSPYHYTIVWNPKMIIPIEVQPVD